MAPKKIYRRSLVDDALFSVFLEKIFPAFQKVQLNFENMFCGLVVNSFCRFCSVWRMTDVGGLYTGSRWQRLLSSAARALYEFATFQAFCRIFGVPAICEPPQHYSPHPRLELNFPARSDSKSRNILRLITSHAMIWVIFTWRDHLFFALRDLRTNDLKDFLWLLAWES